MGGAGAHGKGGMRRARVRIRMEAVDSNISFSILGV